MRGVKHILGVPNGFLSPKWRLISSRVLVATVVSASVTPGLGVSSAASPAASTSSRDGSLSRAPDSWAPCFGGSAPS